MSQTPVEQHVITEVRGRVGCITLNRPRALNALSLRMIRDITAALMAWRDDAHVLAVAVRGMGKEGPFGAFCAGGDIRFFHQAALAGNPELEDFFTEEYALNHLIHTYPKPYIAFMDGIVMGGGMGISQGASLRIVTERSQLAMPETGIGLFPDVGGGYFLSRCPGRMGEYLALTGQVTGAAEALALGLADAQMDSVPVVAAGGLFDGRGLAASLALGADGVWMGTRFIATPEARAVNGYKETLLALPEDGTVISKAFTGKTCRVVRNEWTNHYDKHPDELQPFPQQAIASGKAGVNHLGFPSGTVVEVDKEFMPAGQGVGAITSLIPAGDIVRQMMAEAERTIDRLTSLRR
jgi:enoyl-CoA hydratase/carnithine racemase